jgi:chromosome partitioning protein
MADKRSNGIVISVFNEKGGSGKTTTTCQLAGTLGKRGYDVLVADCDPQQTSSDWIARFGGENFDATCWQGARYGENVAKELRTLVGKFDIIVVDCAPSVEQGSTWGALLVSNLALVPTRLNPQDLAALPAAKRLIRKAWDAAGVDFPARVIATAARLHLPDEKAALRMLEKDTEIPLTKVTLGDRKAYPRSMLYGATVHAVPRAEESIAEVEALADEVLKLVGLPKARGQGLRLAA